MNVDDGNMNGLRKVYGMYYTNQSILLAVIEIIPFLLSLRLLDLYAIVRSVSLGRSLFSNDRERKQKIAWK